MKPIAIFYHSLFVLGNPPDLLPCAAEIISDQMQALKSSGLEDAAAEIHCGINGGDESIALAYEFLPHKCTRTFHGLDSRSENLTLVMLEKWLSDHEDWLVLWFHSKGATHAPGDSFSGQWRNCMMRHLVHNWRQCVSDLESGYEAVGCHWMEPPATPATQFIFAGNFWWARVSFLRTLPSIFERERIKLSGIGSLESRYEAEVWIGNGPRPPKVKDYHGPGWNPGKVSTCSA